MQVAAICLTYSVGFFTLVDIVKFILIKKGGKYAQFWEDYKELVPKISTLCGLVLGIFLAQYFNSDFTDIMTSLGIGLGTGQIPTGFDNLIGSMSDSRTIFGDPSQSQ